MKTEAQRERRRRYRQRRRARRRAERKTNIFMMYKWVRGICRRYVMKFVRRKIRKYLRMIDCTIFSKGMSRLRRKIWRRDHHTCQLCGRHVIKLNTGVGGGSKPASDNGEVHHIEPQSIHPELKYRLDNCVLLCHDCHKLADWINLIVRMETYQHEANSPESDSILLCTVG